MELEEKYQMYLEMLKAKDVDSLKEASLTKNDPEITFLYGKCLVNLNDLEGALSVFETLINTKKGAEAHLEMGRIYSKKGELKKARRAFSKVIPTKLDYIAFFEIGIIREKEGNKEEAKKCYERSIEFKKDSYTYSRLGKLYYDEFNYEKAIECFKNALEINPNDPLSEFLLSKSFIKTGNIDDAKVILQRIVENSNDLFARVELANIKIKEDALEEAEILLQEVLEKNPRDAYANHYLGKIKYKQRKWEEAKYYFEASTKEKFMFRSEFYLAKMYRMTGDLKRAEKKFMRLLKERRNKKNIYLELGRIAFQKLDFVQAKEYYQKSLELSEEQGYVSESLIIDLAEVERFLGNFDESERLLNSCKEPLKQSQVLFQKAMLEVRRGNIGIALALLEEAAEYTTKEDSAIIRALVQCYIKMEMLNEAVRLLDKYPKTIKSINRDFLIYIYIKTGRKLDDFDLEDLNYQERQILNYSEEEAISYITKMQQVDFNYDDLYSDLDLNELFYEIKPLLNEKNIFYKLSLGNSYIVKLNDNMTVKVTTTPDDKILKIFPLYDPEHQFIDDEEELQVKKM